VYEQAVSKKFIFHLVAQPCLNDLQYRKKTRSALAVETGTVRSNGSNLSIVLKVICLQILWIEEFGSKN
jgi:type II secretory pathway component PulL